MPLWWWWWLRALGCLGFISLLLTLHLVWIGLFPPTARDWLLVWDTPLGQYHHMMSPHGTISTLFKRRTNRAMALCFFTVYERFLAIDLTDEELNACMDAYENASMENNERVSISLQTSYWDWLPPEIQVTQLAIAQYVRDNRNK